MKAKYNLVGNTFTYRHDGNLGYSVHGKGSKHIEWVEEWTRGYDTFYVDDAITLGLNNEDSEHKYGWLLESKWVSGATSFMKESGPEIYNQFDMIFTHDQELLSRHPVFKFVPGQGSWIKKPQVYPKSKLVSMISSTKQFCPGHFDRLQWVKRLRKHLDLYGRGFNPIQYKETGLSDYMFSVAVENGAYETYFTEKIMDCFLTGTVPIYLGAPDIGKHFNLDGIILLTDDFDISTLSPELYQSKAEAIEDNFQRALKMEILEDYIWENYLQ